ncbi:formin-like protein 14 [Homalodisca vitripennis]|uniref:formin-like protein 14 n=1 Tax=Homalodisca vitripennis TaxID=197043 RepID=UPI001EEBA98A|nr:formin-like protein 14 [Homalodisca vitripennis]
MTPRPPTTPSRPQRSMTSARCSPPPPRPQRSMTPRRPPLHPPPLAQQRSMTPRPPRPPPPPEVNDLSRSFDDLDFGFQEMDSETVVDLTQSEEHSSILRKLLSTPPPPPLKQQQQTATATETLYDDSSCYDETFLQLKVKAIK